MNKISKINKFFNKTSFLIFIIIPFLKPISLQYISNLQLIDKILDIWKIASIGIIFIVYFLNLKITKTLILIILFEMSIILSSIINNVNLVKPINNFLTIVAFSMLVELIIRSDLKKFIKIILNIQIPLFFINLVLIIIYPNGLDFANLYTKNHVNPLLFLSVDNGFSKWIIPFIGFVFMRYNNKFILISLWILSLISIIIIDSASCLLAFVIFTILIAIYNKVKIKKVEIITLSSLYVVISIIVLYFNTKLDFFNIISQMLGRSATLTGRTELWPLAINLIEQKPIFGYGYTSGNIEIWGGFFSSHNALLEILIHGGIFSLFIFIVIMLRTIKNMNKSYSYINTIIFAVIFSYFLILFVETGLNIYLFTFIILANNVRMFNSNSV